VSRWHKQAWEALESSSQLGRLGKLTEKPCEQRYVCNGGAVGRKEVL
jgi:hypothetical protein